MNRFPKSEIARVCLLYGTVLDVAGCVDTAGAPLDGAHLLWALAGCESSFGKDCTPRHEPGYCNKTNGFYWRKAIEAMAGGKASRQQKYLVNATVEFGCDAHCSFGPWQVMFVNAIGFKPEEFKSAETCAVVAVGFLNREVFERQRARTLAHIADAYNSGSWRDENVPGAYVAKLARFYATEVLG